MAVAALTIGARRGLLYLRAEYRHLLDALNARLARRRAQRLLGNDILSRDFDFDLDIRLGAGAYVCGE
jgi:[NiFe] hydrogenase diaphorase moiety large subunit